MPPPQLPQIKNSLPLEILIFEIYILLMFFEIFYWENTNSIPLKWYLLTLSLPKGIGVTLKNAISFRGLDLIPLWFLKRLFREPWNILAFPKILYHSTWKFLWSFCEKTCQTAVAGLKPHFIRSENELKT